MLDLREKQGRERLLTLLEGADVLLDSSCGAMNAAVGLDRAALEKRFPKLIIARMTPFGDDGPWKDFHGSDLIHLALSGIMMVWLRSRSEPGIRYAADRSAGLARVSYRRRTTCHRHHCRADQPAPYWSRPGHFGRDP